MRTDDPSHELRVQRFCKSWRGLVGQRESPIRISGTGNRRTLHRGRSVRRPLGLVNGEPFELPMEAMSLGERTGGRDVLDGSAVVAHRAETFGKQATCHHRLEWHRDGVGLFDCFGQQIDSGVVIAERMRQLAERP